VRQFIFKTLVIIIGIILVFELTIGRKISEINDKINFFFSNEGRKVAIVKIKEEMQKASKKENFLTTEEKKILKDFINKIKIELELN